MIYAKTLSTLGLLALALAAQAADFEGDFNLVTNGANGWTYGYKDAMGDNLLVFPEFTSSGNTASWYDPANYVLSTPAAFKNLDGSPLFGGVSSAGLHGGSANEIAVARYTAPGAGSVDIVGLFEAGDGGAVDVYVSVGGVKLFEAMGTGGDEAFSLLGTTVAAGDVIEFGVGTAGSFFSDTTPLRASINPVPEPASMVALGLGAVGLLRRRRR